MAWFTPSGGGTSSSKSSSPRRPKSSTTTSESILSSIPQKQKGGRTPTSSSSFSSPPERYMPWSMQLMGPLCCEDCGSYSVIQQQRRQNQHPFIVPSAVSQLSSGSGVDVNNNNNNNNNNNKKNKDDLNNNMYCMPLGTTTPPFKPINGDDNDDHDKEETTTTTTTTTTLDLAQSYRDVYHTLRQKKFKESVESSISPYVIAPMSIPPLPKSSMEQILMDYHRACQLYDTTVNSGILATIRFGLPTMRVSGPFHDRDMMALAEIWMNHATHGLNHIVRLDFRRASKEGRGVHRWFGFRSHGAMALAKMLTIKGHAVQQVFLQRHRIGPYGAAAIFWAVSTSCPSLKLLWMRRCKIGEGGALAAAETLCKASPEECGLREVDLSANQIGYRGCLALERALQQRSLNHPTYPHLLVDMEGNLVFQEVMNGVTHGLGVLFAIMGMIALGTKVQHEAARHRIACTIYSTSLFVLYTSSTLYHSFFTMQHTKYIFEVMDKCAIYILIAGSYTPFLQILLWDQVWWSNYLLAFIWVCCVGGICVEFLLPDWKHKMTFSLSMYLGMGWVSVVCLPQLTRLLTEQEHALHLLVLGGVGYTSGVPFFVRNNNLDHSIWHLFVLAGSIFHWFCIYLYVAGSRT